MIAGIIAAMRSHYPFATRVVWQCIENRADKSRRWNGTDAEIATELGCSIDSVSRAVDVLAEDKVIKCTRHKRRRTTYRMLRTYSEGCPRPRHEPEVASRISAAVESAKCGDNCRVESAKSGDQESTSKNPPEEERESTSPLAAPPPQPPPCSDANLALKEVEAPKPKRPQRTPLPDDWAPTREDRDLCIEAGYEPNEMTEELADWARSTGAQSADWSATWRNWVRREKKFQANGTRRGKRTWADDIAHELFGAGGAFA
jgi:hypothetical protein